MNAVGKNIMSLNQDSKLISALSYPFGLLIALIIYLVKTDDWFVRFHAKQAIFLDIATIIVGFVSYIAIVVIMAVLFVGGFLGSLISMMGRSPGSFFLFFGGTWLGFMLFYGFIFLLAAIIACLCDFTWLIRHTKEKYLCFR